jgi:general secretion pathway protein G
MKRNRHKLKKAFTMVELMAVLVIIGLLAAFVARNFMGQTENARVKVTKASLRALDEAVLSFKMDTGRYPTEEEGLQVLIEPPADVANYQQGGYLRTKELPKDSWGKDFVYVLYPESGQPYEIMSYGADGEPGGEGHNTDLSSADAY